MLTLCVCVCVCVCVHVHWVSGRADLNLKARQVKVAINDA